jgi:hypothetical protein
MSDFSQSAICPNCKQRFAPDDGGCCSICDRCEEWIHRNSQAHTIFVDDGEEQHVCGQCYDWLIKTETDALRDTDDGDECPLCRKGWVEHARGYVTCCGECGASVPMEVE